MQRVPQSSTVPSRVLAIVLLTAVASAGLQMLQRPERAVAGPTPPTNTPLPDTATPTSTATDTSVPNSATPTSTATDTSVPNTATPTSTATDTSVPNTATPTSTAADTSAPNTATPTSTATDTSGPNTSTPTAIETATTTATVTATATITPTAEVGTALCSDGIDNNLNGLIDCFDPSCAGSEPCVAPAPMLSPLFILIGVAVLGLISLLQLRRRLG